MRIDADEEPARGRPRMADDPRLRARNKRWLRQIAEGEMTIGEICVAEDVSPKTVRRALKDASTYPEMSHWIPRLAPLGVLSH